jgi:hypothetical protein
MKYKCPCCGCYTYTVPTERNHAFICDVCFWENDLLLSSDIEPSDSNHGLTLHEAKENYRNMGACCKEMLQHVRPPKPDELKNLEE